MGSVNAVYKPVPFLGRYSFKPLAFEAKAVASVRHLMISHEATFIKFAVYMLRKHNLGQCLSEAVQVVQRAKRAHYSGIFKDYKRAKANRGLK